MKYNREEAISETLKWEGGYSNDAGDPGGPTNYGITIADVRKYIKPGATAQDVKNITKAQAIEVYRNKYWKTPYYDCDNLAPGVDLSVFDFGVNSGPSRAKRYYDKAVSSSDIDTIKKLNDSRLVFLKGLGTWSIFGKGWGRRVAGIRAKALQMSADAKKLPRGMGAGGAIVTGTVAASQTPHHYWPWIIGGIVVLGILIECVVWLHRKAKDVKINN